MNIYVNGRSVKEVQTMRILGLYLQANGKNNATLTKLKCTVEATAQLIRRIANRRQGVREQDLCRLVQAFALSRILYATPYLKFARAEEDKLDSMIRQVYKAALGLPLKA